jgi:branched-chain amino acid transport system ATP-binding protein
MLELEGVDIHYGGTQVLWDVTMRVDPGAMVAVMGPNGSGKSTVLKAVMGLKAPSAGIIRFEGEELQDKSATLRPRRGIAIVLERRRLFGKMTARENIMLGAYTRPRDEAAETFAFVRDLLPELEQFLGATAGKLSGGQQQMVAIARGLMAAPKLLLMDEPFLGLSPAMVRKVQGIMAAIHERGTAILFNEQNAQVSFGMSDHAYLLESGRVILSGSGREMLEHPEVARVYLGRTGAIA